MCVVWPRKPANAESGKQPNGGGDGSIGQHQRKRREIRERIK